MYFTHLQTTLAGSVLGLLGGGMIYIAGQTGLVPALKSSPAVSLGGSTFLGGAIAAISYSLCRVRRIEFEDSRNQMGQEEFDFEYPGSIPPYQEPTLPPSLTPSEKVETFIPSVTHLDPSLIYREEFVRPEPAPTDEHPTHIQEREPEPSPWDEEFLSQPIQEDKLSAKTNGGVKVVKSAFEDFV